MKIWPFVLTFGLIGGNYYADSQNIGRESKPHPRPHLSELDMPHRVATFAVPAMFRMENLIGDGQDWTKPEGKATSETTTEDDPDAGEDPGKKLFWTHKIPGVYDPAPFPGWGYQDRDNSPVAPAYPGTLPPGLTITYTYVDNEIERSTRTETLAVSQPTFLDAQTLKFVADAIGGADKVTDTITIDPVTGEKHHHFHHHQHPVIADPTDPTEPVISSTDPTSPITTPVIGTGASGLTGSAPEPSTWALLVAGFGFLALVGLKKRRGQSLAFPGHP